MTNYLVPLVIFGMLMGCSSPKNTYYTLSAPPVPAATAMSHKTRVMVGPVTLPSQVDSPQLVVQNTSNQVTIYEYQRWAGSLKTNIERVIAANLVRDVSTPNVWSYGQSTYTHYDYQVLIDVQRLESKLGDSVTLDVLWTIKPAVAKLKDESHKAKAPVSKEISGRSFVRETVSGEGFDALVGAQSRAFDQVSVDIAKAIPAK